ncbi:3-deoxy-D-manno-octulosonic-acid transferase (EC [uncultured Gammaproteobacteria bacterium]|nr:3-deoxy-D-manno-octulosonic acid transferase (EC 2.4.99.12)(EC 2.4.99.13) [uncultured Gammaproteobacteria bacterium]VVH50422.1 3-deoxy-D-manno-octulosonic-acid transferase (EC [uncultured Gammaproteobacteria bacterium]
MHLALYNFIGILLLPVMMLRLLLKGLKTPAYRQRIGERLGFIKSITGSVIWVHCVSMGEFRAAIVLIDALIKAYPNHKILVTSTTPTGSKAVSEQYQDKVLHTYFPFDISFIVKRYIKKVQPDLCLLLETEIWPNLIHALHKNNTPTLLVNARLSERSLKKYQKFTNLTMHTLNKLSVIAAQNQNSAERFIKLGVDKDKVIIAGNIKFEQNPSTNKNHTKAIKSIIGKRKVVVFASTHKGEEEKIINAYLNRPLDALMLIIPRHPERFDEVYKLAKKHNIKAVKRSSNASSSGYDMLLGDSIGEMMSYFEVADVVFMGGSLVETGGHNMLEPAALSKPILFGPNVFNFTEISTDLLTQQGSIQVQNADALMQEITQLLEDDKKSNNLSKNANQYFKSQQGALSALIKQIKRHI